MYTGSGFSQQKTANCSPETCFNNCAWFARVYWEVRPPPVPNLNGEAARSPNTRLRTAEPPSQRIFTGGETSSKLNSERIIRSPVPSQFPLAPADSQTHIAGNMDNGKIFFQFWKMHGAANDFILVDDRTLTFPAHDHQWISAICSRRTGIGAEGLILIQPSTTADFRMRFFNPDGSEVEMCGNGARCVARLAHEIGAAPEKMRFETVAGLVGAAVHGERVTLNMPDPKDWRLNRTLRLDDELLPYHFVNSGVPHVIVRVNSLAAVDVKKIGAAIRYAPDFAPSGTNANFVMVTGPHSLRIRTYERGVEAETLACGTGITAAGLIASRLGWTTPPVHITTAGGDVLTVNARFTGDAVTDVTLTGPAIHVFRGQIEYTQNH